MYYQQALKPHELLRVLSNVGECFFVIEAVLPDRNYHVAIYRYDNQYFVLKDLHLFEQIQMLKGEMQGDEEDILPFIETALEENHYVLVDEGLVRLDLKTLSQLKTRKEISILFYEFLDY